MRTTERLRQRRRSCRDERGAGLVEFALIAPILMLLLFAIIDFGFVYANQISVRQGVREGARAAAVAAFGSSTSCLNPFTSGMTPSTDMQELMCTVKNRIGISSPSVYVKIGFDSSYAVNSGIYVCALTSARSITGVTSQLLGTGFLKTKVEMSIEQLSSTPGSEAGGEEAPPSGASWSWCTAAGSTP